ncbi:(E3-independent) E2 ubiquitin-conjugating enzyme UBE2O-like [Acipenser ruthenus]|uniref:(E3-independent) E2 ubiquitin-conjugating enzyme UBE2O-like n=1 Tax=Acipenser ruthenus TaxID=7906 RepID=UPI00274167A3|nr:(E3-independent) E2 ubiquitin-conjugating enzyme UBE2O-like [Acipenser ruthenus]
MAKPRAAAAASTPAPSPAPSPGSEPLSSSLTPSGAGSQRLLFSHDLVSGRYRGSVRFGLVRLIHGEEDSDTDSDSDTGGGGGGGSSDTESGRTDSRARLLGRGYVRVQWYPEGGKQDVRETKLKLEDRSVVPRDMVRRMGPNESQCGTVVDINIKCAVKLVGTNCVLYPVNSRDLQHIWPFMYGDYIAYDSWLGKVYDLKNLIILKLSNGARCSMNTEDGSKLYDVCPHVSDSGLFFDDSYGFYPGQVLIGPAKVFSSVQWLSGVKPVLSKKSKFRVVVEEVQVVELKVTWITKSFCPGGAESVFPPASVITQENLCRVKHLGYFDHAQWLLGERCLYVVPAKGDVTQITCEGPEGTTVLPDGSMAKKVKRLLKKESGKKTTSVADSQASGGQPAEDTESPENPEEGDGKLGEDQVNGVTQPDCTNNGPVLGEERQAAVDLWVQSVEQDADDEAAEDTDDTSSVTSSASSTASSQSGRRKSIPLSIRNLKRKHKRKNKKISRDLKPGDRIAVEVVSTETSADVMWQDGTLETDIRSNELLPIHHLDNNEFCPGDFVVDKRSQAPQDPGMYGVIQSGDHKGRTCTVKWVKLKPSGDDVEVIREEDDVSVYDIADHPDFHFRTTDIVIRIGNAEEALAADRENEPSVGQVARVDVSSKVEVVWADNSRTIVLPQHLYNVESEIEESDYDSVEGSSSGASSEEWEDESDSWETDNGVTEEDHPGESAPAPTPTALPEEELQGAVGAAAIAEKLPKEATPRVFKELKEAIKILESLKNMTVEQLLTGSPTSPTVEPEKQTKEKRFLDDIKKLQENLKKTLDNVAIVEEEKMEAVAEMEEKEEKSQEPQTPVRSEWPSDTPVLCQPSGGKPGVTFTSAKGEVFSVLEWAPDSHAFKIMEFQPAEAKKFFSTVRKEMALLATSLPDGIMVKTFESRMDLFAALIKGPTRTPYEGGLFLFDIQLPNIYPAVPPLFQYLSQCSGRLNPNLYDNGKVCVSLLGTWIGKGTERWTSKSSLLQVLISIQGLILVNEPYYNEAGFDSDRGLQEGYENSRCYNEMALIKMVQSMTQLLQRPVEVFQQEIREHFSASGWRLVHRIETWLELNELAERSMGHRECSRTPEPGDELSAPAACSEDKEEELEDSGLGACTTSPQETSQHSDSEGAGPARAVEGGAAAAGPGELRVSQDSAGGQPSVKPKKRRKSYRSFLPEKRGYPDIGFPLFPLSKGFIKSISGVLQHYRAALAAAGIPERREDK